MAKSKEVKRKEAEERNAAYSVVVPEPCQWCHYHKNKPSICLFIPEAPIYVGRKDTCPEWRKKS